MYFMSLLVVCLVRGVFGNDLTCKDGIGPDHLKDLYFTDFAVPWGRESLETFCEYLEDFYGCIDANDERIRNGPNCEPIFKYFHKARKILQPLCMKNEKNYKVYKRYEECYQKVKKYYNRCLRQADMMRLNFFEVPKYWPRDVIYVQNCIKGTQFVFCIAERIKENCYDQHANVFYLKIVEASGLPTIYCYTPYLWDVNAAINEMTKDLFRDYIHKKRPKHTEL